MLTDDAVFMPPNSISKTGSELRSWLNAFLSDVCDRTAPRGKRTLAGHNTTMGRIRWLLVALVAVCSTARDGKSNVAVVSADDPAMNAAMSRARAEVGLFIARLAKPQPGDRGFFVKIRISDGHNVEHIWADHVRYQDRTVSGTLDDDSRVISGYRRGDQVSVPPSQTSDWMYVHNGVLVGGYAIPVLHDRMSPGD